MTNADAKQHVVTQVRGHLLSLVSYTRSLELCARMNYETEVLDFIDQISPGKVLYDLGACEGRFALYAAKRKVQCYAFEPEAANFQAMQENLELNGDVAGEYLHPVNCAVGDRSGTAILRIGQPWAGGHHKTVADAADRVDLQFEAATEQEIRIVALDEYIASAGLPAPDYLKVDVDGSEIPFMKGAARTLASPNLKGIIFELYRPDDSYSFVTARLQEAGFTVGEHFPVPNAPDLFNVLFAR
jgi:FkbM family methyltransferase